MTYPTEEKTCGIPALTLPPCDKSWGHDGDMHSNGGDGFYSARYAAKHKTRQQAVARLIKQKGKRRKR